MQQHVKLEQAGQEYWILTGRPFDLKLVLRLERGKKLNVQSVQNCSKIIPQLSTPTCCYMKFRTGSYRPLIGFFGMPSGQLGMCGLILAALDVEKV